MTETRLSLKDDESTRREEEVGATDSVYTLMTDEMPGGGCEFTNFVAAWQGDNDSRQKYDVHARRPTTHISTQHPAFHVSLLSVLNTIT